MNPARRARREKKNGDVPVVIPKPETRARSIAAKLAKLRAGLRLIIYFSVILIGERQISDRRDSRSIQSDSSADSVPRITSGTQSAFWISSLEIPVASRCA